MGTLVGIMTKGEMCFHCLHILNMLHHIVLDLVLLPLSHHYSSVITFISIRKVSVDNLVVTVLT